MDPGTNASYKADLHIRDGVIAKIGPDLSAAPGEECLDAEGFIIAPGLIDTHTHFRDPGFPHKETLHTGALAAARGGFTSVICMANTSPAVDSVPVLQDILERAKQEDIRVFQAGTVSQGLKGQVMTDMPALKEAGACGFTDDGIPITNAAFCYEAMKAAEALGVPISLHEEDPALIRNNGINHGEVSRQMGLYGLYAGAALRRPCGHSAYQLWIFRGACTVLPGDGRETPCRGDSASFYPDGGCCTHPWHPGKNEPSSAHRKRPAGHHPGTVRRHHRHHCNGSRPPQRGGKGEAVPGCPQRHHRTGDSPCSWDHVACPPRPSHTDAAIGKNDHKPGPALPPALWNYRTGQSGGSCDF